jgi:hypothetical protein
MGRVQNELVGIMREIGGRVLAPSAILVERGRYKDLPGMPLGKVNVLCLAGDRLC